MEINPIKTEAGHKNALDEVYALFNKTLNASESDRFESLVTQIEAYEEEHYPIEPPESIGALEYFIESRGFTPQDLAPYLGSESCVTEILGRRRALTQDMIQGLETGLRIPAGILRPTHELIKEAA